MNPIRKHRNSSLLTLAGAAVALPASATVVNYTLPTPLTIGGPELTETSGVSEAIYFNPKTGDIGSWRGSSSSPTLSGDYIVLEAQTRVAGDSKPGIAMGQNIQFTTLGNYSTSAVTKPDLIPAILPERLDAGRTIGAASNWGMYKPLTIDSSTVAAGLGLLGDPTGTADGVTYPFLWGNNARGSVGFAMDALTPTGNFIDDLLNETDSSTWANPLIPEYEQRAEFGPSGTALYGWAEIGINASGTTFYGYAYESTVGESITTSAAGRVMEISAVPEPANALTLASLLGGSLLLRSRRRAPASTADA